MMERDNWSLDPNPEVRQQNMDAAIQFFAVMRARSGRVAPNLLDRTGELVPRSQPLADVQPG
jgi:hypothetical protein